MSWGKTIDENISWNFLSCCGIVASYMLEMLSIQISSISPLYPQFSRLKSWLRKVFAFCIFVLNTIVQNITLKQKPAKPDTIFLTDSLTSQPILAKNIVVFPCSSILISPSCVITLLANYILYLYLSFR